MIKTLIAIPVYNGEKSLLRTFKSALSQSKKAHILIVDNASIDKTYDILNSIEKLKLKNLTIIRNKNNLGRTGNWNKCLYFFSKSQYLYIKYLFSGDLIDETCIEETEKIFESHINIGAVVFPYKFIDKDNNVFISKHKKYYNRLLKPDEVNKINIGEGGILGAIISNVYSKESIGDNCFDESEISKSRFDIRVLENSNIYYMDKVLGTFDLAYHQTFDIANSLLLGIEFSYIEVSELQRLYKNNKFPNDKFKSLEQKIIINTFNRLTNFADFKTIFICQINLWFFTIINFTKKFLNNKILLILKKFYYK